MIRKIALYAAVLLALPMIAGAEVKQKAGKWEISIQTEIPGMPFKMPAMKTSVCLTEEDVSNPEKQVPRSNNAKDDCQPSEYKRDGDTVTWTVNCPKQKMTGKGQITFAADGDSYEGWMKLNSEDTEITTKYKAKFLGDCEKKK